MLLLLLAFTIIVVVLALRNVYSPSLPQLKGEGEAFKAILQPDSAKLMADSRLLQEYRGFRHSIRSANTNRIHYTDSAGRIARMACPIRAAFYVDWDAQAFTSLRANISRMNMVLPEWLFIDPRGDTLYNTIDARALTLIKASGVQTVPMLSNFFGEEFDGEAVHRILTDDRKRARLIQDVAATLQRYKFSGINVDFEELREAGDEPLVRFMQELYETLHPLGLLVTQDVAPLNEDYNLKVLSEWNDYLFLMSYDQHNPESNPGPVSEQKWIEATVAKTIAKGIAPKRLILCIAGYGYDWPKGGRGKDLTYEEALTTAQESEGKIVFDNDSYNLHYSYYDENDSQHEVHFTDAATNFNTLRFAAENDLSGVALWRLGSEDKRLWTFYMQDVAPAALKDFEFKKLEDVMPSNAVDYIGEGEVLDVIATPQAGHIALEVDSGDVLISEEDYRVLPSSFVVKKFGKAEKKMVLTFDDGPDADYTPRILDILRREHVPAAFFLLGNNAERNIPIVKRIYREGHEIGNHSFTHPNMAEISLARAALELNATRLLIACITGHSTILFRPPYNADSEPETLEELKPVALSRQMSYLTIGENIDPNDWEAGITADTIFSRIVQQKATGNIILLHDAGGNREATVKVLPHLIQYFRSKGYSFTTIADLIGKSRDELMPPLPRDAGYNLVQLNYYLAVAGYWGSSLFGAVFLVCIVLSGLRILALAALAASARRKARRTTLPTLLQNPLLSIIVPAYNESLHAVASVRNLLQSRYANLQIIFVDDGSTDATSALVRATFGADSRVKVLTKPNGGKASALNLGIAHADGEYLLCIDADTKLLPDAAEKLMRHFANARVAAVAGKVRVGNEVNIITRWQSLEYITSQNFDRLAFGRINAITVVPGAIGAFRKSAVLAVGGFASDTFAEDCDLTMRLLRAGYIVANDEDAAARTEAPETVDQFLRQRFRWTFGVMQAFWKNRDALFARNAYALGWVALPNILIFQFLIPLLTPFADLLMLLGLITGNGANILFYYLVFLVVDCVVASIAFAFGNEAWWKLFRIIPQRLAYRWLMLYVLLKAMRRAIKGELQHWGVLKRTGNVRTLPN